MTYQLHIIKTVVKNSLSNTRITTIEFPNLFY